MGFPVNHAQWGAAQAMHPCVEHLLSMGFPVNHTHWGGGAMWFNAFPIAIAQRYRLVVLQQEETGYRGHRVRREPLPVVA